MPKKVILDVDPGIDDALALCLALSDAELEVVAITAVGGNVDPQLATRNVQAILEQLDPPRWPRVGVASMPEHGLPVDGRFREGIDGLGGVELDVAELRSPHPSDKIICDAVRAVPETVTSWPGPADEHRPGLPARSGAALPGRPGVDDGWNGGGAGQHHARRGIQHVLRSDRGAGRVPLADHQDLIPLDVTNRVVLTYDLFRQLPDETTKRGHVSAADLAAGVPQLSPAIRPGRDPRPRSVALMAVTTRSCLPRRRMAGDVEIMGELTTGATVFDRRRVPAARHNMEVALEMDMGRVMRTDRPTVQRRGDLARISRRGTWRIRDDPRLAGCPNSSRLQI